MDINKIKRYVFPLIESNMFAVFSRGSALIIDPHISEQALHDLEKACIKNVVVLLTHEHYDHTSGVNWIGRLFPSTVICHRYTADSLREGKNNRPIVMATNCINDRDENIRTYIKTLPVGYTYQADRIFERELRFSWQGHAIRLIHTPGHSPGSCCIEMDDNVVATGDSLLRDVRTITKFPGGSSDVYYKHTVPYLRALPEHTCILPGHGEVFTYSSETIISD